MSVIAGSRRNDLYRSVRYACFSLSWSSEVYALQDIYTPLRSLFSQNQICSDLRPLYVPLQGRSLLSPLPLPPLYCRHCRIDCLPEFPWAQVPLLAKDLISFENCSPQKLFKQFIDMPGQIDYDGKRFTVRMRKRATTPILLGIDKLNKEIIVPWLDNKPLRIIWTP